MFVHLTMFIAQTFVADAPTQSMGYGCHGVIQEQERRSPTFGVALNENRTQIKFHIMTAKWSGGEKKSMWESDGHVLLLFFATP